MYLIYYHAQLRTKSPHSSAQSGSMVSTGIEFVNMASMRHYTKNGIILPTGQWYAPSAVNNDAWYCMVVHGIALYCIVLHGIAWYCIVLHGIALYCMVLHGIAWYCTNLHYLALSCTILYYLALSCTILHYLALSIQY